MQMIGRGMRGVQAGGTATVNIVDFHDKWDTFNRWLDPEWLIEGEVEEPQQGGTNEGRKVYSYEEIEWGLCRDAYRALSLRHFDLNESVAVPCGWYSLVDEEGQVARLLVFENQMEGMRELVEDCDRWSTDLGIAPEKLRDIYFPEMGYRPSLRDVELLVHNVRTREKTPEMFSLEDRDRIEPALVVKEAEESGKDIFAYAGEVYDEQLIARELFGDRENYIMTVCRAKIFADRVPVGSKVEELPYELIPFSREAYYDINELSQEVIEEMFGGSYDGISSITWTKKAYRSYYGVFYEDDNSIKINCVLNSKDVPREVVKFVIYLERIFLDPGEVMAEVECWLSSDGKLMVLNEDDLYGLVEEDVIYAGFGTAADVSLALEKAMDAFGASVTPKGVLIGMRGNLDLIAVNEAVSDVSNRFDDGDISFFTVLDETLTGRINTVVFLW